MPVQRRQAAAGCGAASLLAGLLTLAPGAAGPCAALQELRPWPALRAQLRDCGLSAAAAGFAILPQWSQAIAQDCAALASHSHAAACTPAEVLADLARDSAEAAPGLSCIAERALRHVAAQGAPHAAAVEALLHEHLSATSGLVSMVDSGPQALDAGVQRARAAAAALVRTGGTDALERRFAQRSCICDPCECVALAVSVAACQRGGAQRFGALGGGNAIDTVATMARWALHGASCAADAPAALLRAQCTAALLLLCALFGCFGPPIATPSAQQERRVRSAATAVLQSRTQAEHKHLALLLLAQVRGSAHTSECIAAISIRCVSSGTESACRCCVPFAARP